MSIQGPPSGFSTGYQKTAASGLSGAVATLLIWILDTYVLPTPFPDLVVGAVVIIVGGLFQFFVPEKFNYTSGEKL